MDDYDRNRYRVVFFRVLSALLGLIFAVDVAVALYTGQVTTMRTGRRAYHRDTDPGFYFINVGVSAGCAVVLLYAGFRRRRGSPKS